MLAICLTRLEDLALLGPLLSRYFVRHLEPNSIPIIIDMPQVLILRDSAPIPQLNLSAFQAVLILIKDGAALADRKSLKAPDAQVYALRESEVETQLPKLLANLDQNLQPRGEVRSYKDLSLDCADSSLGLVNGNKRLVLTQKEAQLLKLFFAHPGRLVSRDEIKDRVWSGTAVSPRTIDSQISRLRRKVEPFGVDILNHYGAGFVFS